MGGVCEICGMRAGKLYRVSFEGAEISVCPVCASKLGPRASPVERERVEPKPKPQARPKVARQGGFLESYDIVEDFGARIRRAREERGWNMDVLARKLKISVDLLRKIESGKYKPPLNLAKTIEGVLKVKLIVPTEYEEEGYGKGSTGATLGDVVVVRRGEE